MAKLEQKLKGGHSFMTECEKIESRIKQVFMLEKIKTVHLQNKELTQNLEKFLADYFVLVGSPIVSIDAIKGNHIKIIIEAQAERVLK